MPWVPFCSDVNLSFVVGFNLYPQRCVHQVYTHTGSTSPLYRPAVREAVDPEHQVLEDHHLDQLKLIGALANVLTKRRSCVWKLTYSYSTGSILAP